MAALHLAALVVGNAQSSDERLHEGQPNAPLEKSCCKERIEAAFAASACLAKQISVARLEQSTRSGASGAGVTIATF
jgi:hypothetical protein